MSVFLTISYRRFGPLDGMHPLCNSVNVTQNNRFHVESNCFLKMIKTYRVFLIIPDLATCNPRGRHVIKNLKLLINYEKYYKRVETEKNFSDWGGQSKE